MKKFSPISVVSRIAFVVAAITSSLGTVVGAPAGSGQSPKPLISEDVFGRLPLSFEPSGQADQGAEFISAGSGYSLRLSTREAVFSFENDNRITKQGGNPRAHSPVIRPTETTLRMTLVGANASTPLESLDQLPGKAHEFFGADARQWRTDIPTFAKVRGREVYPGIDVIYYGNQRQLEYDFVVSPGADSGVIRLSFGGADQVEIDAATGDLLVRLKGKQIRQRKPLIYQDIDGAHREIDGGYVVHPDGAVSFNVAAYDRSLPLVIDPILAYSTFLPFYVGSQNGGLAVDGDGNVYVAGGDSKVYVAKINPAGTAIIYTARIGGTQTGDAATDIAVDSAGNAYVTGDAWSSDFPVVNAFQAQKKSAAMNDSDCFVFKLNPTGAKLIYSTYLGGGDRDDAYAIAVDPNGNAYVTGYTESPYVPSSIPFPTKNAYQPAIAGDNDAFLSKFSPTGALVYSTYLGGEYEDLALDVAVDPAGSAYLTGVTDSLDFPVQNALKAKMPNTNGDMFVTKFSSDGLRLVFSTYLGGSLEEIAWGLALDASQNIYLTGQTFSNDFPTVHASQRSAPARKPNAFVTKLNAAATALVYSTYLGGNGGDVGNDIVVDSKGAAYIAGYTGSTNFPTLRASQPTSGGGVDAFVTKLTPQGSLQYSTYWGAGVGGGIGADYGNAIALDSAGTAYLLGETYSDNFPLVNALRKTPWSQPGSTMNSAFLVKLSPGAGAPFFRISGRVDDGSGNPIVGATITLSGEKTATATTNADGTFAFTGLTAGKAYTVSATKDGLTFAPPSQTFGSLSADRTANFSNGPRTYSITGRVTDANGNGISGVNVAFSGSVNTSKSTASDGSYTLAYLAAGTSVTVTPSHPEYAFTPQSYVFDNMHANAVGNFAAKAAPPNASPSVTLTSPVDGATISAPVAVSLKANATDSDGSVTRVEFYVDGTLIATDSVAPYSATWTPPQGGAYTFDAIATDDRGAATSSGSATIIYSKQ